MSDKEKGQSEGNIYDRIFKENAESIFIPLIQQQLGFKIESYKPIIGKISKTIEREMDLLYEVVWHDGQKKLLHIEFQTRRDPDMLYRMAEYHGLAFRKYRLPIHHLVIFLGEGEFGPNRLLKNAELFKGFDVLNLHRVDPSKLLQSQVPEMVILALLANFSKDKTPAVLRAIIRQLKRVCTSEAALQRYITQLTILSRLRKLRLLTSQIVEQMTLGYNVYEDDLFLKGMNLGEEKGLQKGLQKGLKEGLQKGLKEGLQKGMMQVEQAVQSLLKSKLLSEEQIAEHFQLSIEEVLRIKEQMK
ncbi:MAG: hypothetical protein AAF990_14485 [Bacteroidota bacterium]